MLFTINVRTIARVNNTYKTNKWLTIGLDVNWRRGDTNQPQHNPLYSTIYMPVIFPGQWADGSVAPGRDLSNPYAVTMFGGSNRQVTDRFGGKLSVIIEPVKGLTITGIYAPGMLYTRVKNIEKKLYYFDKDDRTNYAGTLNNRDRSNLSQESNTDTWATKQLFVNYKTSFGSDNRLEAMVGYEDYYRRYNSMSAATTDMEIEYFYLDNANKNQVNVGGSATENAYRSLFGRINYSYLGRYLAQVNLRSDKSSRFGSKYRTGFFPSGSLGWIISDEPFLRDMDYRGLSHLKLRASYGTLGNERIGDYPYQKMLSFNKVVITNPDGSVVADKSVSQTAYNIDDITWETTHTWDVGFDANFLSNRLSVTFDYYCKKTKDMLLSIQIPKFMGYSNPKQNAGDMNTRGWDLQLSWNDHIGQVNYGISVNLSDYRSRMGKMSGTVLDSDGKITCEGNYFNAWYGYESDGLYQTEEDLGTSPHLNGAQVGDIKYKDISGPDGVPDGIISPEYDRKILGSSLPELLYGGTVTASWKGIDFAATFQGVGHQNVMKTEEMVYRGSAYRNFPAIIVGKYWSNYNTPEENLKAEYPKFTTVGYGSGTKMNYAKSDFWMFDGGYFRCKNITLGYTFPAKLTKSISLSSLRVFASVSDPFCFSHFPEGWDPEMLLTGTSYISRTWNFGVKVSF